MPHSSLLRFSFSYTNHGRTPLIPVRFLDQDGKPEPTFNAILDSGADEVTIPKEMADKLGLELEVRPRPIHTAGGARPAYSATANFNLGRGGREVRYIDICVTDVDMPVLIGITPIF